MDVPVGDDAAADAGADLDQEQVVGLAPVHPVLAAGHDVDVVVDEHGRAVAAGEPLRDREAVPAGHDRRVDRPPAVELDRARARRRRCRARRRRSVRPPRAARRSVRRSIRAPARARARCPGRRHARPAASPARSLTARRAWVAPRSATRTTPASRLKARTFGGRPPVESCRPPRRRAPSPGACRRAARPSSARAPSPRARSAARHGDLLADQLEQRARARSGGRPFG